MLIHKNISLYVVFESETIFKALEKINANKKRIIFVLADNGVLMGSLTDGDFRRWVTSSPDFDVNLSVSSIMNAHVSWVLLGSENTEIYSKFSTSIDALPIVDSAQRVVSVAFKDEDGFAVGGRIISDDGPAFIIAEIGNNHNGSLDLAKRLVDLAFDAGADCVKFQMRDVATLYKSSGEKDHSADLGAQYTMDLLSKFQLENEQLFDVFDYCKSKGLTPLCTPWDPNSLQALEEYGMEFYKVASADLTNHPFLETLINTGKPLICSTGMSTELEIKQTANFLRRKGATFALLHCNSTYPTPFKDVNLAYLKKLKDISGGLVGYSGHERGTCIPVAAITLGAKIIEKHFTVDQSMEGNDHKVSLLPDDFKRMVAEIRAVEESIGTPDDRLLTQGEMLNRETLAKSIIACRKIDQGEVITREMLDIKSPGQGLQPMYIDILIGRKAKRFLKMGDCFFEGDLTDVIVQPRDYKFSRPFGIPVRYHDYQELCVKSNFDFVEFHLSYQDLNVDLASIFEGPQDIEFAVHAPELFSGDHLLDLTSQDKTYREHSIKKLQSVCEITRELKVFFPKTKRPVIVLNAGGFSSNGFLSSEEVVLRYTTLASSLSQVDQAGVEIIIQTMPPFPWHFGGQSYHNLFVDPEEISRFCTKYNYRICFDVSHTMMACNYYNWGLSDVTRLIGPHIAHMHVVDALGTDGEGVQIGQGDVDFRALAEDLRQYSPHVMFLPEVWQGHKNKGEGFWSALEFLESYNL
jgi:sialic acid synthase SpsE/sugar phosphate isomerase/epimerase